jgi:hypothetical protein
MHLASPTEPQRADGLAVDDEGRAAHGGAAADASNGGVPQRAPAPYAYPPEAQLVTESSNNVVLGIPIDPVVHTGSDYDDQLAGTIVGPAFVILQAAAAAMGEEPIDDLCQLVAVFHTAQALRPCAVAETLITALFAFVLLFVLVLLPLPAIIYFAARSYAARIVTAAALVFFPLAVGMRVYAAYLTYRQRDSPERIVMIVAIAIAVLIDIYSLVLSLRFARSVRRLPEELRSRLADRWTPTAEELVRVRVHLEQQEVLRQLAVATSRDAQEAGRL